MTLTQFEAFIKLIETTDQAISREAQIYEELLEDCWGVPRNLAKIQDLQVGVLAKLLGVDEEAVAWFVYECNFGNIPLEYDGVLIDSTEKFYSILKESDD